MNNSVLLLLLVLAITCCGRLEAAPPSLPVTSASSLESVSAESSSLPIGSSSLPTESSISASLSNPLKSELSEASSQLPPVAPVSTSEASEHSTTQLSETSTPEHSESSENSGSKTTLPPEEPDPVGKMIDNMLQGRPVNTHALGVGKTHTIALANKNDIYKEGPDEDEEDNRNEEAIKKGTEAGQKRHQEEVSKIHLEGRNKKINLQRKKVKNEERAKAFDDELRTNNEQNKKKAHEQESKSNEDAHKKLAETDAKRRAALESSRRAEELQKTQMTAAIQQAKAVAELEKKKAAEEIEKTNAEAKLKLDEASHKHDLEAGQKRRAEQAQKRAQEVAAKKQAEANAKAEKARQLQEQQAKEQQAKEQQAKEQQAKQEQAQKAKQQAEGRTCGCMNQRVAFNQNNLWLNCPGGHLMTGLYRGNDQFLRSIEYYQCCKPCRDDGSSVLSLGNCVTGQWQSSFDSQGWSNCPDQTFMAGLYKSSCEWIYCIEYAQCCHINGSRGRKACGAKGSWGLSLDRAGWSVLDANQFMIGLYRSSGHYLYNIEYPNQCTFFAYG